MRPLAEIIGIAATTGICEDQITDEEEAQLRGLAEAVGGMDLKMLRDALDDAWKYRELSK